MFAIRSVILFVICISAVTAVKTVLQKKYASAELEAYSQQSLNVAMQKFCYPWSPGCEEKAHAYAAELASKEPSDNPGLSTAYNAMLTQKRAEEEQAKRNAEYTTRLSNSDGNSVLIQKQSQRMPKFMTPEEAKSAVCRPWSPGCEAKAVQYRENHNKKVMSHLSAADQVIYEAILTQEQAEDRQDATDGNAKQQAVNTQTIAQSTVNIAEQTVAAQKAYQPTSDVNILLEKQGMAEPKFMSLSEAEDFACRPWYAGCEKNAAKVRTDYNLKRISKLTGQQKALYAAILTQEAAEDAQELADSGDEPAMTQSIAENTIANAMQTMETQFAYQPTDAILLEMSEGPKIITLAEAAAMACRPWYEGCEKNAPQFRDQYNADLMSKMTDTEKDKYAPFLTQQTAEDDQAPEDTEAIAHETVRTQTAYQAGEDNVLLQTSSNGLPAGFMTLDEAKEVACRPWGPGCEQNAGKILQETNKKALQRMSPNMQSVYTAIITQQAAEANVQRAEEQEMLTGERFEDRAMAIKAIADKTIADQFSFQSGSDVLLELPAESKFMSVDEAKAVVCLPWSNGCEKKARAYALQENEKRIRTMAPSEQTYYNALLSEQRAVMHATELMGEFNERAAESAEQSEKTESIAEQTIANDAKEIVLARDFQAEAEKTVASEAEKTVASEAEKTVASEAEKTVASEAELENDSPVLLEFSSPKLMTLAEAKEISCRPWSRGCEENAGAVMDKENLIRIAKMSPAEQTFYSAVMTQRRAEEEVELVAANFEKRAEEMNANAETTEETAEKTIENEVKDQALVVIRVQGKNKSLLQKKGMASSQILLEEKENSNLESYSNSGSNYMTVEQAKLIACTPWSKNCEDHIQEILDSDEFAGIGMSPAKRTVYFAKQHMRQVAKDEEQAAKASIETSRETQKIAETTQMAAQVSQTREGSETQKIAQTTQMTAQVTQGGADVPTVNV